MTVTAKTPPRSETQSPATAEELAEIVARAAAAETALYPVGGGTGLNFGLPARRSGLSLSTTQLNRVVDYPARDMTITVEAGRSMQSLRELLATQGQRLPVDAPQADTATIGGVIATATSGPRRFGHGSIRDFVIGISAVDGRGVAFKAGGRVVKNVAGYDFCKLLTGSRGALAVITQVTLKLRPVAESTAWVVCDIASYEKAETVLAELVRSAIVPTAIELVAGPAWERDNLLGPASGCCAARLLVGVEGAAVEVAWMTRQLQREWREQGIADSQVIDASGAAELWSRLCEFPVESASGLTVKATVRPSAVTRFVAAARAIDERALIQSHAGNGIVYVRYPEFTANEALPVLVRGLQPAAVAAGGHAVVYQCPADLELTHQAVWGPAAPASAIMASVKKQFDPAGILNPGLSLFAC